MTTTKDKLEFALAMGRHTRASLRQVQALMRYAGTLRRLAEDDCNVAPDDSGLAARERKRTHIAAQVNAVCADICDGAMHEPTAHTVIINENPDACRDCGARGDELNKMTCSKYSRVGAVSPVFSGDPRGAVLKIRVPSGYSNDMGREGICVPS